MKRALPRTVNMKDIYAGLSLSIIIVILTEPGYFMNITVIDRIFEIFKVLVTLGLIIKYVYEFKGISKRILLILLYEGIVLFSTILNMASVKSAVIEVAYVVDFCLLTQIMIKKNIRLYIFIVYFVFEIYNFINLASCLIYPEGLYVNGIGFPCYFLGYKNTAYKYLITLLIFSSIYSILRHNKIKINVYCDVVLCLLFDIITNTVTGTVVVFLYFMGLLLYGIIMQLKMKWVVLGGIICSYLLVFVRFQNNFVNFFSNVLGRSVMLSGRTKLWDILIIYIKRRPIMGWGVVDMIKLTNIYWANQAHNQFLQVLYQCGIIGLSIFVIILLKFAKEFDQCKTNKFTGVFILSMIIYMIAFQTEGYLHATFYIVLLLMLHSENILCMSGGKFNGQ